MKILSLTCFLCIYYCLLSAQDITITFTTKSDTVKIDSVLATNLKTRKTVRLLEGDSLLLVKTSTSLNQLKSNPEIGYIYPNPTVEDANFCVSVNKNEKVDIRLYNSNGQMLVNEKQNLMQGTHRFMLKFPVAGIYYLSLLRGESIFGFKAVYTGQNTTKSSVLYLGGDEIYPQTPANQFKNATTDNSLVYTEGDVILYSCHSGLNTTIISDVPTQSKSITVEFVKCMDYDQRNYKTVKIGNQTWMAENLAYLPDIQLTTSESYTEPRYYVYGYTGSDVATAKQHPNYKAYGVLYNWHAAKAACPTGWHLPSDDEWKQLEMALGMTQAQADGTGWRKTNQGKQMKATRGWYNNGNGTNTSGFSALPGGYLYGSGSFGDIGSYGRWWGSTESSADYVWGRRLLYEFSTVFRDGHRKKCGFSVRCVMD
jgi:uncharacterized protein (TIGR02145 family)